MVKDLVIWQKLVDLNVYIIPICSKFPKNQRFVLGQQIQNQVIDMVKTTVEANKARNKIVLLDKIDTQLEGFRFLTRTAYELKMLPVKRYEYIAKLSSEIGRLIGGWQKKFK